ncbi:NAD(P)H-binding protein [Acetobacter pasteurianus]
MRNILSRLAGHAVQLVLMTAIGVTDRKGAHDWKRRAERLVRASGSPYTIVRPGWFDYNTADQHKLVFLQGDTRKSGTAQDGVIARADLAEVLVSCLDVSTAQSKTFELVSEQGARQSDMEPLFSALEGDKVGALDGAKDPKNMPITDEPQEIVVELEAMIHEAREA